MNWKVNNKKLTKTFECKTFNDLIDLLNHISKYCDTINHHPDFNVFNYNNITFELYTHDMNTISKLDYELANFIDEVHTKYYNN